MPNKRKTVQEREQELAQRIMEDVNAGMDARFARFEHLFERLAPPPEEPAVRQIPPPDPAVTRSKKRAADQQPQPGSPSPKVSRSATNNQNRSNIHSTSRGNHELAQPQSEQTPARPTRQSLQATPRHPLDGFAEQARSADQQGFAEQGIPASHRQQSDPLRPSTTLRPPRVQTSVSDSWAAWSSAHNQHEPSSRYHSLPTSVHEVPLNHSVDAQVQQLLASTVHNLGKGNTPPYDFPYKYILRGPEKIKASINSVTLPEHLWGIFRIIHDPKTLSDTKPCLMAHIEQIVEDAREYEWDTGVRRWSEEVFSRISEGRLASGWHATDEIQRLRMILAQSKPMTTRPNTQNQQRDVFNRRQPSQSQPQADILKGGPPCPDYNSTAGCSLKSGHIKDGKRLVHICAFCLHNTSATNTHSEAHCRNKVRLTGGYHHFQ